MWLFLAEAVVAERSSVASLTSATTEACKREGGFCVIKSQCPKDKLSSTKGLCGKSDKECCHSRNNTISFLRDINNNTIISFFRLLRPSSAR
jgi:hypothetical protein